jgi:hypothetical protein
MYKWTIGIGVFLLLAGIITIIILFTVYNTDRGQKGYKDKDTSTRPEDLKEEDLTDKQKSNRTIYMVILISGIAATSIGGIMTLAGGYLSFRGSKKNNVSGDNVNPRPINSGYMGSVSGNSSYRGNNGGGGFGRSDPRRG